MWHRRIYPVKLKPRSRYNSWNSWPQELVPFIKLLTKGFYRGPVFKCEGCGAFCEPHPNGIAMLTDGRQVCDDCLLERAQQLASGAYA